MAKKKSAMVSYVQGAKPNAKNPAKAPKKQKYKK